MASSDSASTEECKLDHKDVLETLIRLRKRLLAEKDWGSELCALRAQVVAARQRVQAAPVVDRQHQLLDAVRGVWSTLATLHKHHELALPPLYTSNAVDSCLSSVVGLLDTIESNSSGGNRIIQGVIGVGKTTMLQAAQLVGVLVFDVLCPIGDFSSQGGGLASPLEVLRAAVARVVPSVPQLPTHAAAPGAALRAQPLRAAMTELLHQQWRGTLFLGDEINALYQPDAPAASTAAVSELACIGKTGFLGSAVLTGSAASLADMAFCRGAWEHTAYSSMNHSVFTMLRANPIRTVAGVADYYRVRYNEEAAPELLFWTGGVGRSIDSFRRDSEGYMQGVRDKVALALDDDPVFVRAVSAFLSCCSPSHDNDVSCVPQVTLGDLKAVGVTTVDAQRLVDRSLLFRPLHGGTAQLLYPAVLPVLRMCVESAEKQREHHVLRSCFASFHQDVHRDAEPLLLRSLARRAGAPFHNGVIRQARGTVALHGTVGVAPAELGGGGMSVDVLCGQGFVQVAQETGIDAFRIQRAADEAYELHWVQIKLGQWKRTAESDEPGRITPGKLRTARRQAWQCLRSPSAAGEPPRAAASRVEGCTIASVVAKAEVGMDRMLTLLKGCFPDATWRTQSFRLITSKRVTAGDAHLESVAFNDATADVHGHVGVPVVNAEARCTLDITVMDHDEVFDDSMLGTEWM